MSDTSTSCSGVPREPGTYVLVMHLLTSSQVIVGKLGVFRLSSGWYHYVGSALGPGGLGARLARHRRRRKRRHWHIDYLVNLVQMTEIWWMASRERTECAWASALKGLPEMAIPVPGFGSSDCRCPSHLLYSLNHVPLSRLLAELAGTDISGSSMLGGPIGRLVSR